MTDNKIKDPRNNLFYYFGLIAFSSGLLCLTVLPSMVYSSFLYLDESLFVMPALFLLLLAMFSWQLSNNTQLHQSIAIGCGLIFYSLYQITIKPNFFDYMSIIFYLSALLVGFMLVMSSYNLFGKKFRTSFNLHFLLLSILLSFILVVVIIFRFILYV
ncbi:MAG: hypothetical protein AB7V50_09295 [Vampirovibrionia bacterium]